MTFTVIWIPAAEDALAALAVEFEVLEQDRLVYVLSVFRTS